MEQLAENPQSTNTKPHDLRKSRLGINLIFTSFTLAVLLVIGSAMGYLSVSLSYSEKQDDTWAIVYLNLEREIVQIRDWLKTQVWADNGLILSPESFSQRPPDQVFRIEDKSLKILSSVSGNIAIDDIVEINNLFPIEDFDRFFVWRHAGEDFLVRSSKGYDATLLVGEGLTRSDKEHLFLWRVSTAKWFEDLLTLDSQMNIYLINRNGQLLYSSSELIDQQTLQSRRLVQEFIEAPLKRMQLEINEDGNEIHGAFNEIQGSNLVLFLEMPKDLAMAPVYRLAYTILALFSSLILFVFLLLQWPLRKLTAPLKELVWMTSQIRSGNYRVRTKLKGIGELQHLHEAFDDMTSTLMEKEAALEQYIEEQKEAVRLQGELNVAQSIQDNLLSVASIPKSKHVDLAFTYIPAQECAGDWHGSFYREETGELIVAQADVSGHGVGSALFTAMIASMFEDFAQMEAKSFATKDFLQRLNHVFMKTGQSQWHATFSIIKFNTESRSMEITCAGSTPYILLKKNEDSLKGSFHNSKSDPIGIVAEPHFNTSEVLLERGELIYLFTDGITEARNEKKKMYGQKRLKLSLQKHGTKRCDSLIRQMLSEWKQFVGDEPQEDDICLVAMRV